MACARPQVCVVCACSAVRFPRGIPLFSAAAGRRAPPPAAQMPRGARGTSDSRGVVCGCGSVLFCSVLEFGPVPTSPAVRIAKKINPRAPPLCGMPQGALRLPSARLRATCCNDSASGSVLTRKNEHRRREGIR